MLQEFRDHLSHNFPMLTGKKLLLAVSGGIDSMVMADLFINLDYTIAIAHCNFNLRGDESDRDAHFVRTFAKTNKIRYFEERYDTIKMARDYRLSIQQAARELRYTWFTDLMNDEGYDFTLTAHQADDNLETFLINLSRGTGLDGLVGIPPQNKRIIRPMLPFGRKEIAEYASQRGLKWVEDSSNESDKYIRNKIRQKIVPELKKVNASLLTSFSGTLTHLLQAKSMVEDASILIYKQVAIEKEDKVIFKIPDLIRLPNYSAYLYHWLHGFGFRAWDDIYNLPIASSGKFVLSDEFRLLKDREILILERIPDGMPGENFDISEGEDIRYPINLHFCQAADISGASDKVIFVGAAKLEYPLRLRRWEEGDQFSPLGMRGRTKKVSKFFKDIKLPVPDKEKAWLLCSAGKIVWIVGLRQDERFKVDNNTKQILRISTE